MSDITIDSLRPGDIGFGPIHGAVGLGVRLGQLALAEGFTVGGLKIAHVFVVTDTVPKSRYETQSLRVVEAMPSGARRAWAGDRWSPEYAYVRLPEDYPGQASDAAAIARAMIGTPYSFASYAALAAWRAGLSTPRLERWINRRKLAQVIPGLSDHGMVTTGSAVALPREAICSVLADQAWSLTGKKIMVGVPHQCVTPGALAARLLTMRGVTWTYPGSES